MIKAIYDMDFGTEACINCSHWLSSLELTIWGSYMFSSKSHQMLMRWVPTLHCWSPEEVMQHSPSNGDQVPYLKAGLVTDSVWLFLVYRLRQQLSQQCFWKSGRCLLVNLGASLSSLLCQTLGLSWCLLWLHFLFHSVHCVRERRRQDIHQQGRQLSIERTRFFSALCFKQIWRDLSACLQLHCVRQAHCSLLKE